MLALRNDIGRMGEPRFIVNFISIPKFSIFISNFNILKYFRKSGIERLSLLKLCSGEMRDSGLKLSTTSGRSAGIVWWFTQGTGGRSARHLLIQRQISSNLHWTRTLHPYVHCLGHLLYVIIFI